MRTGTREGRGSETPVYTGVLALGLWKFHSGITVPLFFPSVSSENIILRISIVAHFRAPINLTVSLGAVVVHRAPDIVTYARTIIRQWVG